MFDKLKKLLEGGVAQVNPFDGGKTYQSVVNNRTPQQQNAVQQQQAQARTFRQPGVAPQQTLTNKLRDILDANTEADKFRRAQVNQSTDYATQQREEYGVKRAPMNVGSQLFGNAARFANTAGAALGEIQDTSAVYGANVADAVTGGNQTSRVLEEVNKRQQARYNPKSGIFGAGTWFDNQDDFRKSTANPVDLARKAAVGTIGTAFEAGSMGAGQKVAKLADVGLKQFLARGGKAAAARAVEGVIADAASQNVERDNYSAAQGATAAVAGAGLPIVARGAAKVLRPVVGAASDALGRIKPRSVAEIAQEVNIARTAPAIAENAPAPSRVSGAPTPRPASEIAAELAASKARAIDPNVAARRASFSPTEQIAQIKRVNVSPDDQRILADFNDIANGVYKPDAKLQRQIELDATRIAEKYNIPLRSTALETADEFDNFLQRGVTKPEFAPKPSRQTNQLAPKPSKYKDADEFVKAQGEPVYHGTRQTFDEYNPNLANTARTQEFGGINATYFSPKNETALRYAQAANSGKFFSASVIDDIKKINPFLADYIDGLYKKGDGYVDKTITSSEDFVTKSGGITLTEAANIANNIRGSKSSYGYIQEGDQTISRDVNAFNSARNTLEKLGVSASGSPRVMEGVLTKDAKIKDIGFVADKHARVGEDHVTTFANEILTRLTRQAKEQGYDGVKFRTEQSIDRQPEIAVWNTDKIKTKKQLIEEFEQLPNYPEFPYSSPKESRKKINNGDYIQLPGGKDVRPEAPQVGKTDPLEALKAEARKYKSADEFVKAKTNAYHGTDRAFDQFDPNKAGSNMGLDKYGTFFTSDAERAKVWSKMYPEKPKYRWTPADKAQAEKAIVMKAYVDNSNPLTLTEVQGLYDSGKIKTKPTIDGLFRPESYFDNNREAIKEAMDVTGKQVFKATAEGQTHYAVADSSKMFTEKQLTDLYNQATKPQIIKQEVPRSWTKPKTAFEQNTGVVAPTRKGLDEPKAPITEQIAPSDVRISSAITDTKPGIKERGSELREQLVSRFAPVEDLVSRIEKNSGVELRPSKNPLSYVRQYLGGGGIANSKIDNELTPIIKQTKEFDGLREYLVAKRMNELADRGMSKRADDVLEGINKKYGAEVGNFEKVAKELYAYQNKQIEELVDVGVLTREAADNIRAKNQYYVPFNRVIPELEDFAGTTPGNAIGRNGNPIKAIHGSDKDIIDPIESMIRNTYDIQATVQKQKVMRSLYELAPDEFRVPARDSMNKNRVGMFLDGKKTILETSEPLARSLNSMAEEQMNLAVRVMSLPAKMLRSGATSLNVAFALPNIVRDQLSAAVNSKYGGVPIYDFVSGLASVIGKDDSYKKWITSGADQASFFAQDRTTLQRGVKDITGGAAYKVGKYVRSPLELFRVLGEFSEKGSRVGVYKRAEKGAMKKFGNAEDAVLAAAKESREATIDFARRGSKMKAANSLIPFLNARLQGTLKLANSFKERPVQTGAVGMAIAGLPAAALYIHNSEYPEYAEIPDYIKRENFIIMTGSKETPFIKIPKGEVGKIFGNPVESFLAQAKSDDPSWKSTAASIVDSFLPVGSVEDPGKFVTDLMPTAASVPLQMTANFDTFRGMPIVSQWQKDLPPEQQFTSYNTETGKKIGAALGVSPAMLEFGIGGLTGGLGRQALQIADMATGNKIPTQDLPVISRFAGEQKDLSKSAGEVYDQIDKDKRETARANYDLKQALKKGDTSGLEGMDKTKANRLKRSVKEDEIKKTLSPTEKALWQMSKEDLENYSGKYEKEASKVLGLKDTLSTSKEAKTNKEKYEAAQEEFDNPDNGYSRVEKVKKREELKRLTVQKDYDEDTTMLHGMSKEDVYGFLSTYEDGKAQADKLLALDDALTAAGVQDKNKFRDKYGNVTIKPKEKGSGGSKAKTVKGQAGADASARKLRALLASTNNKTTYRSPGIKPGKASLKKFAVKSAGLTSRKQA